MTEDDWPPRGLVPGTPWEHRPFNNFGGLNLTGLAHSASYIPLVYKQLKMGADAGIAPGTWTTFANEANESAVYVSRNLFAFL